MERSWLISDTQTPAGHKHVVYFSLDSSDVCEQLKPVW